jgi:hypothetical protein
MAFHKLPLPTTLSKAETHTPAQQSEGLYDHDCRTALDRWRSHIGRLRLLVEHSQEFTPPAFMKAVDGSMPDLRRAAMLMVICSQILNGEDGGI